MELNLSFQGIAVLIKQILNEYELVLTEKWKLQVYLFYEETIWIKRMDQSEFWRVRQQSKIRKE